MTFPSALRRIVLASAFTLLALAPAMLTSGDAKAGGPPVAQDYAIDQFYDELAPFGDWVYHPDHGYVWLPRAVEPEWRPFTVGRWIDTEEYGWYWESYEPFAWAVYHYGRWGVDPEWGWFWVPGDTWAPAWVQWRYGDEYVGWAPEAPEPYGAYAYGGPARYAPPPPRDSWVFVEPRYLTAPAVRSYAVPRTSISIAFSRTTYVYRPEYRNGYVYNYGMPRDHWSRITRKRIEPRRIHHGHRHVWPNDWNRRNARDLYVYAPRVKKGAGPRKPPKKVAHKPHRPKDKNAKRGAASAKSAAAQRERARAMGWSPPTSDAHPGTIEPRYRGPNMRGQHPMADHGPRDRYKPQAKKRNGDKPKAANAKVNNAKKDRSKPDKPKFAKAKSGKPKMTDRDSGGRGHYDRTEGRPPRTGRPPQAKKHNGDKLKAANAKEHKPKSDKPKSTKSKSDNAKAVNAKARRDRAMSLAPPTSHTRPGSINPRNRGPGVRASKPHYKPKAVKSKPAKPKGDEPKANAANAKKKSAKPKAQKPKANAGTTGKAKATKKRTSKPKSAQSKSTRGKPKSAKASRGGDKHNRKRSAGGHGGGDRAKGCKANRNTPACGPRG
jgi:uncharacterized protein DUF6600